MPNIFLCMLVAVIKHTFRVKGCYSNRHSTILDTQILKDWDTCGTDYASTLCIAKDEIYYILEK